MAGFLIVRYNTVYDITKKSDKKEKEFYFMLILIQIEILQIF
jgi:hypothetical protein